MLTINPLHKSTQIIPFYIPTYDCLIQIWEHLQTSAAQGHSCIIYQFHVLSTVASSLSSAQAFKFHFHCSSFSCLLSDQYTKLTGQKSVKSLFQLWMLSLPKIPECYQKQQKHQRDLRANTGGTATLDSQEKAETGLLFPRPAMQILHLSSTRPG